MSTTESPICDHPPEQPHGNEDEMEEESVPDLEDLFVEAGALGDMKAALEKAKALKAMLASGLPSKVCSASPVVGQNQSAGVADRCSVNARPRKWPRARVATARLCAASAISQSFWYKVGNGYVHVC